METAQNSTQERQKARWIYFPGDVEIFLGNRMNNQRTERGAFFPVFWKTDGHYPTVEFSTTVDLQEAEKIHIEARGQYNLKLDGKLQFGMPREFTIPQGTHKLCFKVHSQAVPPALRVEGTRINTSEEWLVTYEDKEWIDESGKASDTSATDYFHAGAYPWYETQETCAQDSPTKEQTQSGAPDEFHLQRRRIQPVKSETLADGALLVDFGKESFGYLSLKGISGEGDIEIIYGESREEALSRDYAETLDRLTVGREWIEDLSLNCRQIRGDEYILCRSKAFRYVLVAPSAGVQVSQVEALFEYLPEKRSGSFACDNEEMNRIWQVAAYTMDITTRECFIDGIKRDRWTWSGDAVQSYLMNYYLRFDLPTVKRTMWALRGKDPVTSHINTIMDYTFYWLIAVEEYYLYSKDDMLLGQIYPRMRTLIDYALGRTNRQGMVEGLTGDWVFVDWVDFKMRKTGALSFEQILLWKALQSVAHCALTVGKPSDGKHYSALAEDLKKKIHTVFWDPERKALIQNFENGALNGEVDKFSNMFAIIYGFFSEEEKQEVLHSVMLNDDIAPITTPYMRFYELEAMCQMGCQEKVTGEILSYWGGMLKEGATTFWEKYNPKDHGREHLAMYGRPFGKSLCHAWGASPVYLLGKYFLGVRPLKAGYEQYEVRPSLGALRHIEGEVCTPWGKIYVRMSQEEATVISQGGSGELIVGDKRAKILPNQATTIKL